MLEAGATRWNTGPIVRDGEIQGISNYYPQRPLPEYPGHLEAVREMTERLIRARRSRPSSGTQPACWTLSTAGPGQSAIHGGLPGERVRRGALAGGRTAPRAGRRIPAASGPGRSRGLRWNAGPTSGSRSSADGAGRRRDTRGTSIRKRWRAAAGGRDAARSSFSRSSLGGRGQALRAGVEQLQATPAGCQGR